MGSLYKSIKQPRITWFKSTIGLETPEQYVKSVKVNDEDTTTSITSLLLTSPMFFVETN